MYNQLVMNSQQQESSIGEQNMLASCSDPRSKYVTYLEMQKYLAENPLSFKSASYNIPIHHEDCKPTYLAWNCSTSQPPPSLPNHNPNKSSFQWILNQSLSLCCFSMRLYLQFRLRRNAIIEITKYRGKGSLFEEEGIKYTVENRVTSVAIKIFIVKENKGKVWKQIEIPISSYEVEAVNKIEIKESTSGDIAVSLNGFQFMVSLKRVHLPGLLVALRSPTSTHIEELCLEQVAETTLNEVGGCAQEKCLIF